MSVKITTEIFIQRAQDVHGNAYVYTNTVYIKMHKKVIVTCPAHGDFEQTPNNHLHGKGCPTCSAHKTTTRQLFSTETFINKATAQHGAFYDYSLVNYVRARDKVSIVCPRHGEFQQEASSHMNGKGCCKCAVASKGIKRRETTETFIEKANLIHKNKYVYVNTNYISATTLATIACPTHGEFKLTPNKHLSGRGCQQCSSSGFSKTKHAILYYLKIQKDNSLVYKIGVTNRTVEERFTTEMQYITILLEECFLYGTDAYEKEQQILKEFKMYKNTKQILIDGNTEMFTKDILNLDIVDNDKFQYNSTIAQKPRKVIEV